MINIRVKAKGLKRKRRGGDDDDCDDIKTLYIN
jgi:hypothetical protein